MKEKDILILDTNFIVENKKEFDSKYNNLSKTYDVYVSEVSINERVSQRWRELKKKYDDIEKIKLENNDIVKNVYFKINFKDKASQDEKISRKAYKDLIQDKIIDMPSNTDLFSVVLDRAYKKIPPFINEENSSDKGFKDTLLWLSILAYFRDKKISSKVYLVTNDNGFSKYNKYLLNEFKQETGLNIEILDNSFYKRIQPDDVLIKEEKLETKELSVAEKQELRDKISNILFVFCNFDDEDYYGNHYYRNNFKLKHEISCAQIKAMLMNLKTVLKDNAFAQSLNPSVVFSIEIEIKDLYNIPIKTLEDLYEVYSKILSTLPDYETAFLNEACNMINKNIDTSAFIQEIDDDDLPF